MSRQDSIKIGQELIEASENQEQLLPLSTQLFPYLVIASRKMSLRRISSWLQEKHGVSLSAAAISRALNSPETHLERLADSIAPLAQWVATAYGHQPLNLLFNEVIKDGPIELQMLAHDHQQPHDERDVERWGELHSLVQTWEAIPYDVCVMLKPYLREVLGEDELVIEEDYDGPDENC